ncbi:hypothetical protein ACHAXS_010065 [Conticribra weissflogii]
MKNPRSSSFPPPPPPLSSILPLLLLTSSPSTPWTPHCHAHSPSPNRRRRLPSPRRPTSPFPRIISGTPAPPDRYPYIVSLTYRGSHLCGASLIAPDVVLTAAHCAGYATSVEVGRYDRSSATTDDDDDQTWQSVAVQYEVPHPSYDEETVDHDVMLVKLVAAVADPALASLNVDVAVPRREGDGLTIMGWGDTDPDEDAAAMADRLLHARLAYVSNEACEAVSGEVGPDADFVSYRGRITENMMCAMGEAGEDTCQGDSGSPMVLEGDGDWRNDVQVGVVSWGIGCASPIFPGVYARVSSEWDWIRKEVNNNNDDDNDNDNNNNDNDDNNDDNDNNDNNDNDGSETNTPPPPPPIEPDDPTKHYLTLELALDAQPHQTSWILSSLFQTPQQPRPPIVATVPTGFYAGYPNHAFHHKLEIPDPHQFYRLRLLDAAADGMDDDGYVAVYRGSEPIAANLLAYDPLFRGGERSLAVYPGEASPSYFTLAIRFDNYPKDLSWTLELIRRNGDNDINSDNDSDSAQEEEVIVLAQRPPQWYNERFELLSIVETIPVLDKAQLIGNGGDYRLTVRDEYPCEDDPSQICGDGICCDYGKGEYVLYEGSVEKGVVLARGGEYEVEDVTLITAEDLTAVS